MAEELMMSRIVYSGADTYSQTGYLGPIRAVASDECRTMEQEVVHELALDAHSKPNFWMQKVKRHLRLRRAQSPPKYNRHFDWPLMKELVTKPAILDCVESILGGNLVVWRSNVFFQHGSLSDSLPWHRDSYSNVLANEELQVSVQIALTPTTTDNCLEIIPGSHAMSDEQLGGDLGLIAKPRADPAGNTHYRQVRVLEVPTHVVLEPGMFLVFHPGTVHRSSVAAGSSQIVEPRLCLTFRYTVPGNVLQRATQQRTCALVRGNCAQNDGNLLDWTPSSPTGAEVAHAGLPDPIQ